MLNLSLVENQIYSVTNFHDFISTPFQGDLNAICWQRELKGDFLEIIKKTETKENITVLDEEDLLKLELSEQGQLARDTVLNDYHLLKEHGASPTLNIIKYYERDEEHPFFPTDVYSFHVDRSPIPTQTILCTYYGASSDILPNSQAQQKILVPEIRDELKKQFLQNIISESDRLNRLIDKILDLEKFETGKQTIHPNNNNIIATIEHSIESLQQLIKNKKISISIENNESIFAFYDEDRIIQVVTNLVSNAIKFCPEDDGIIAIKVEINENFVVISVHDNGKGINPNDFEVIFDKFYQASNQNFKKPVGSGLGLAICKQIIEHHKGKIWVKPSIIGACIVFTLPLQNNEKTEI